MTWLKGFVVVSFALSALVLLGSIALVAFDDLIDWWRRSPRG